MRPKLSQDELLRNQEHEREAEFRSKALEPRFGYLDVFEKERQEKLQAMKEFQRFQKDEQERIDARRPALFQKKHQEKPAKEMSWREVEHEAFKKLKKSTEMNFDPEEKT